MSLDLDCIFINIPSPWRKCYWLVYETPWQCKENGGKKKIDASIRAEKTDGAKSVNTWRRMLFWYITYGCTIVWKRRMTSLFLCFVFTLRRRKFHPPENECLKMTQADANWNACKWQEKVFEYLRDNGTSNFPTPFLAPSVFRIDMLFIY